jgi:predicted ferric reductase
LDSDSAHLYWYLGRASGFVAFGLLFLSVVLGLAISSRIFDGLVARPWVFEMHQFLSIYVLLAMAFHGLILLPDPYMQFSLWELLVPMASPYRPVAVALGVVVLYGSIVVSLSYYVKGLIGQRGWRLLHYLTFALFLGALVHGVLAGTDSGQVWTQVLYLSTGLAVLFFTFFRILVSRRPVKAAPARGKTARQDPRGGTPTLVPTAADASGVDTARPA